MHIVYTFSLYAYFRFRWGIIGRNKHPKDTHPASALVNHGTVKYTGSVHYNATSMSNLGKPAYLGRPDPQRFPDRVMLILVIILIFGFIRAAIKYRWFDNIITFILS